MNADDSDCGRTDEKPVELFDRITDHLTSRRSVLAGAAAIGGGTLFASATSDLTAAGGTESDGGMNGDGGMSGDTPMGDGMADGVADLNVLNFALLLERLEVALYEGALASSGGAFDERAVERSDVTQALGESAGRYSVYQRFETIRDQEREHVEALTSSIEEAGGTPLEDPGFDFSYESVEGFVEMAVKLEDIGRAAYAGVAPMIQDDTLLSTALSVHSVEARHVAYLRTLDGQSPFPEAFDPALSMMEVEAAIRPYLDESATTALNDADVEYLRMMIMHHGAAVEMAELVPERTDRPELLDVSERIIETQNDEIVEMRSLLLQSGESAGTFGNGMDMTEMDRERMMEMMDEMGDMGMDREQMMTMMQDMRMLERKRGTAFDLAFVDAMLVHHETAIEDSKAILDDGKSDEVADLARRIVDIQTTEVEQMREWRADWS